MSASPPPPATAAAAAAASDEDAAPLADFLAAKARLQDRMAGARADMAAMRGAAAADQRAFDALLQHVRRQVAALVDPAQRRKHSEPEHAGASDALPAADGGAGAFAPPSTPVGLAD
jgi:hypothetical protein